MNTISIETKSDKNEPRSVQKANSYQYQLNWNRIRSVLWLLLLVSFGGVAHGAVVLQPPGLLPGDRYRLVFVTYGINDISSPDINVYNAFVQTAASASPLAALGTTWRAIGSTSTVNARDNTGTVPSGPNDFPIYRLDGLRVAPNNAGLWDGGLDAPILLHEYGESSGYGQVYTGTLSSGLKGQFPLGASTVMGGSPTAVDGGWMLQFAQTAIFGGPIYALSAPITVPVPELSSCALMGMGIAAWASGRRRSKKSPGLPPAVPNA